MPEFELPPGLRESFNKAVKPAAHKDALRFIGEMSKQKGVEWIDMVKPELMRDVPKLVVYMEPNRDVRKAVVSRGIALVGDILNNLAITDYKNVTGVFNYFDVQYRYNESPEIPEPLSVIERTIKLWKREGNLIDNFHDTF